MKKECRAGTAVRNLCLSEVDKVADARSTKRTTEQDDQTKEETPSAGTLVNSLPIPGQREIFLHVDNKLG